MRITWFSFFIIIQWCSWFQTINGLYKLLTYFHTNMYVSAICGSVLTHFVSIHFCCFINKACQSVKNRWAKTGRQKFQEFFFFICSLCLLWQIKRKLFGFIIMGKFAMQNSGWPFFYIFNKDLNSPKVIERVFQNWFQGLLYLFCECMYFKHKDKCIYEYRKTDY